MKQQANESVNAFVVRIRAQAIRYGFDEQRVDEEVFFQIMQGAKSEKVKQYAAGEFQTKEESIQEQVISAGRSLCQSLMKVATRICRSAIDVVLLNIIRVQNVQQ